uniref:Peroxidasin-like protein n=1 Tax=Magallana gigas TaxID=29159 RepID=K1PQD6_MAGGI
MHRFNDCKVGITKLHGKTYISEYGEAATFSCLIGALFTEYWVDADGYHFGVFKYCVDNTSTCQDVTSQLQTIEVILETSTVITFAHGVTQLPRAPQIGWSFYITICMAVFTLMFFFILLLTTFCCNKRCYLDRSSNFSSKLTFITPPQNVSVDVGKAVSVFANVRNASNVYWCKGKDQVIRISSTFRQQFDESNQKAELTLSNARLQDDVKPVFTIKPNDVTVHSGDELYTEAVVNNAEVVSWLHQGKILSSAKNKIAIKFVNGKASLRIDGTTKKDEGDYTCLAKSGTDPHKLKEESVDFHVSVSDAELPSFENVPQTVNIKNGTAIEMAIKVRGFPMPKQVAWFKDGEPVVRSRKTIMQYIDGASKLVIYDTGLADAGLYECYAENEHGNDKCTIPVKIKRVDHDTIECSICMDRPPSNVLPCGHAFCLECIGRYVGN